MKDQQPIRNAAAEILASSDVWDMTLPWMPVFWEIETLARFKRAGYTFISLTLQDWWPTFEGTLDCIRRFKQLAETESNWLMFGGSIPEIEQGRSDGKLVLGFNSQETVPIGTDLSRIETLYAHGIRHMLLAYNVRNVIADGCAEAADAGLSNFGRQVVREMNRVGMIIDGSHTGRRSSLEAIALSERPPIFSHSGVYSVCPHIRNIRDDQIRACADRDGVVGIVGVGAFLGDAAAPVESVFRHIDYVATLVGSEHVGLGTDYIKNLRVTEKTTAPNSTNNRWPDPLNAWPDPTGTQSPLDESDCFRPEQLAELVDLMLRRGYSNEAVKGILGANFKRVYATTGT